MRYCKKCLNPETRPRITFNADGVCNACNWAEKKKSIDWQSRREKLNQVCETYRKKNYWDVIVPCSGGKDGSYVAWKMKHEFEMHPLCVTFSPPMQTDIGRRNLENFRNSGFDLIEIRPNPEVYRRLCKRMFIDQARSKFPFVIGIATAVSNLAIQMGIPLIIYGEEGETEYGGAEGYEETYFATPDFVKNIYHEGNDIRTYLGEFTEAELSWWLPMRGGDNLAITWWSKYESWDDQVHRNLAITECGLQLTKGEVGTFTNYAQLDDNLQDLHQYEMFIKYGHGRATADCNLAIHSDRMTREEAIQIVKEKDGLFPIEYLYDYCQFFNMTTTAFMEALAKHANKNLLKKI